MTTLPLLRCAVAAAAALVAVVGAGIVAPASSGPPVVCVRVVGSLVRVAWEIPCASVDELGTGR